MFVNGPPDQSRLVSNVGIYTDDTAIYKLLITVNLISFTRLSFLVLLSMTCLYKRVGNLVGPSVALVASLSPFYKYFHRSMFLRTS